MVILDAERLKRSVALKKRSDYWQKRKEKELRSALNHPEEQIYPDWN